MNQEANLPEVDTGPTRAGGGLSDEQISEILGSLPREAASSDFTDGVMARIRPSRAASGRTSSSGANRISGLATLLFGSRPGFGMVLASSAAVALVAGLAWSQFFGVASRNASSGETLASSEPGSANAEPAGATPLSPETVRGTRVGSAGVGAGYDGLTTMPNGYFPEQYPATVDDQLRADYVRLQRQLMLLRQLQSAQSPLVEIGTNGEVHYVIDLSDVMSSQPAAEVSSERGGAGPPRF